MKQSPTLANTAPAGHAPPIGLRLIILTLVLLVVSAALISYLALKNMEHELLPEMEKKAFTVGRILNAEIIRALDYGLPFRNLRGMDAMLQAAVQDHRELKYVAVTDAAGAVLYQHGARLDLLDSHFRALAPASGGEIPSGAVSVGSYFDTALRIRNAEGIFGTLHIGVDKAFVQTQLEEIFYDVLISLLVSLLITFEILLLLIAVSITTPIKYILSVLRNTEQGDFSRCVGVHSKDEIGRFVTAFNQRIGQLNARNNALMSKMGSFREEVVSVPFQATLQHIKQHFTFGPLGKPRIYFEKSVTDVRAVLFLFVFAEELSRSFFPIYTRELFAPIPGLSYDIVIGLPISIFMLLFAITTPWAGVLCDRVGSRRLLMMGIVPAVLGFIGTGLAHSLYDLLLWRSLTAVGYATVTIACQNYIINSTLAEQRAKGMAVFVGAIIAAGICGTSIGGILADRIGFRSTYFISAGFALLSAFLAHEFLRSDKPAVVGERRGIHFSDFRQLLANPRFAVLVFCAAMPAKMMLAGFLFYLTPLYLDHLGNSQSVIGRIMMLYFIAMVFVSPLTAHFADKVKMYSPFVAAGGLLAGLSVCGLLFAENTLVIVLSVLVFGIAQALGASPQLAVVPAICEDEIRLLGQSTVFSVLRMLERLGSVIGPFVVAGLLGFFGYAGAIIGVGLLVGVAAMVFSLFFLGSRHVRKVPT